MSDCNSNSSKACSSSYSSSISTRSSSSYSSTDELNENESSKKHNRTKTNDSSASSSLSRSSHDSSVCSANSSCMSISNNSFNTTRTSSTRTTRSSAVSSENVDPPVEEKPLEDTRIKCLWHKCNYKAVSGDDETEALIEHIKSKHIYSQKECRRFRCLWEGCAVYKNPSCSFNWLERHVIDHIDTKPFVCIFNGCKRKFRTEAARERHVQCHINTSDSAAGVVGSGSPSPVKAKSNLLKSAQMALIQNMKNKSLSSSSIAQSVSASALLQSSSATASSLPSAAAAVNKNINGLNGMNLSNYAQILKSLQSKKRKNNTSNDLAMKKFKKVQYKDYIDQSTVRLIEKKLRMFDYKSGTVTFNAKIVASQMDSANNAELFLVEWQPKNM